MRENSGVDFCWTCGSRTGEYDGSYILLRQRGHCRQLYDRLFDRTNADPLYHQVDFLGEVDPNTLLIRRFQMDAITQLTGVRICKLGVEL